MLAPPPSVDSSNSDDDDDAMLMDTDDEAAEGSIVTDVSEETWGVEGEDDFDDSFEQENDSDSDSGTDEKEHRDAFVDSSSKDNSATPEPEAEAAPHLRFLRALGRTALLVTMFPFIVYGSTKGNIKLVRELATDPATTIEGTLHRFLLSLHQFPAVVKAVVLEQDIAGTQHFRHAFHRFDL